MEAKPHPHSSLGEQLVGALPAAHVGASWLLSVLIVIDLERRWKERGEGPAQGEGDTPRSLWVSFAGEEWQPSWAGCGRLAPPCFTLFETSHKSSLLRDWKLRFQLVD